MTQYLLAVHHDGTGPDISPEEMKQSFADIGAFNTNLMDPGALVFPGRLLGVESATVAARKRSRGRLSSSPSRRRSPREPN
jgi:hypothetical protein